MSETEKSNPTKLEYIWGPAQPTNLEQRQAEQVEMQIKGSTSSTRSSILSNLDANTQTRWVSHIPAESKGLDFESFAQHASSKQDAVGAKEGRDDSCRH